jgi:hypothetical protein
MALDDAVRAAYTHRRDIVARLDDAGRARFAALWRTLLAATDEEARWDAKEEMASFLAERLPPEHPVRRALIDDRRSTLGTAASERLDLADLRDVLADLEWATPARTVAELAHEALLAFPSLSAAQVRRRGLDPDAAGLIRLRDPAGAVRLPSFQFGPDGRPVPVVVAINELLGGDDDPWGVASWWLDRNAWLAERPAALLGHIADDDLVAAARADLEVC